MWVSGAATVENHCSRSLLLEMGSLDQSIDIMSELTRNAQSWRHSGPGEADSAFYLQVICVHIKFASPEVDRPFLLSPQVREIPYHPSPAINKHVGASSSPRWCASCSITLLAIDSWDSSTMVPWSISILVLLLIFWFVELSILAAVIPSQPLRPLWGGRGCGRHNLGVCSAPSDPPLLWN